MEEMSYVTVDNVDYLIMDEIIMGEDKYVFLCNENDPEDFFINKIVVENGDEYLYNLDNEEEYDKAFKVFLEKNKTAK
jgi:hypothetical protein